MQIGLLQCGAAPDELVAETGDYPDMFETLLADAGFTFRRWNVEKMQFPADIHEADGWLITGSRHGVYENHPFIPPLEDFIRRAYRAAVPMVGVCFGHQIIAQALGGKVEKYAGGWAVGAQDYDFEGQTVRLNAWHQDQVVVPPPAARVLARNGFCDYAALSYPGRALSVQAHPEFTDAFIEGLIETRGPGRVDAEKLAAARARMGVADSTPLARRIAAFFRDHGPEAAAIAPRKAGLDAGPDV